jgi:uncharacterized protein (DUF1800 family)
MNRPPSKQSCPCTKLYLTRAKLAARFFESDGDLKEVARTLVAAPESWSAADRKLKRPAEWMVMALRATGAELDIAAFMQAQNLLGEPLWRPAAPNGFSDDDAAWIEQLSGERVALLGAQRSIATLSQQSSQPLAAAPKRSAASFIVSQSSFDI